MTNDKPDFKEEADALVSAWTKHADDSSMWSTQDEIRLERIIAKALECYYNTGRAAAIEKVRAALPSREYTEDKSFEEWGDPSVQQGFQEGAEFVVERIEQALSEDK